MSFQSFNKTFFNIVISSPISINPHVYNLVSRIFTIIKAIVGTEECDFSHCSLFKKIHMFSLYISIPFFSNLILSSLSRKLFHKRIS